VDLKSDPVTLESVITTADLDSRPSHPPDYVSESRAMAELADAMAGEPENVLRKLAETALVLCHAHSAGFSFLEPDGKTFRWPIIVGEWAHHTGGGTLRDYGPCGTVLDLGTPQLMTRPERVFNYLVPVKPHMEEVLLIPFSVEGKTVGTIWVMSHDKNRRFDAEDLRLMKSLGAFASAAYRLSGESERRSRAWLDALPTPLYTVDAEGYLTQFNQAAVEFAGRVPRLGKDKWCVSWNIYRPDGSPLPHEECPMAIALREDRPIRGEEIVVERPDGSRSFCLPYPTPLHDGSGKLTGAVNLLVDITERKQVEQRVRESREELGKQAGLLDLAHEPIVVRDLDEKLVFWNKGAENLYGWTAEEALGKHIHNLLHTKFPVSLERALEEMHSNGFWEGELRQKARNGAEVIVISRWVPQRDSEGRHIATLDTKFDITERKRAEIALRTTEKLASAGRMAATLAHEINNPLEAVTNLIYLAQKEPSLPDSAREYLKLADEELSRVGHMARQTLGIYRERTSRQQVLVSDVLRGLLSMYSPRLATRRIKATLEANGERKVSAISGELRQVFSNLLSNSMDAVGNGGEIRFRVTAFNHLQGRTGGGVRVTIADNGPGVPAPIRKRIFEPFFTTKRDVGTGLGLWVSRGIVERHGGSIRLHSHTGPGKTGTVISVFLPDMPQAPADELPPEPFNVFASPVR
jgi:PAS domain S-box-containing protein